MKILALTNLFPTPWAPTRAPFNRQQFEHLARHHTLHTLTAVDFRERLSNPRSDLNIPHLHTDHFTYLYPPLIGRSLHALCWLLSLLWQRGNQIRNAHYDCLLASWAYPDAVAVSWLARKLGVPYVMKLHGSDINVQAGYTLRRMQIRSALRHANGVVAVSRALADKAIALGADPAHTHVIYNGVDSRLFAPGSRDKARQRLQLATDAPLLLYVGNLKASKGCIDLLEAFPALLAAKPQARLLYIGDGPCRAELLQRATTLGCAERVELKGAIKHDALGDWFRAADLLCLPSHNEGVPNVVLEAMACGTPVVATRVGGIPEVVPAQAGILVPVKDRAALSAALLESSERGWDGAAIAAHAATFRWEDNVNRLATVLQQAITPATASIGAPA